MPRKTRKQKQMASIRKIQQSRQVSQPESIYTTDASKEPTVSAIHEEKSRYKSLNKETQQLDNFFANDLKKTLLLTILVFTLEFFLYYATMNNYLVNSLGF